jgi:hypothetical protein
VRWWEGTALSRWKDNGYAPAKEILPRRHGGMAAAGETLALWAVLNADYCMQWGPKMGAE